jgi:predicted ATP-dependent serine protease
MMLTGVKQWDKTFGGLSRKARYIIAAYGGAGKTALAAQIAANVAMQGYKVRYMLFEETPEKIWARVAANKCRVSMRELRNEGGMTVKGQKAFMDLYSLMEGKDMLFLESPQTVPEMLDLCQGADLIVVDGVSDFPCPPELTKIDKAGWVSDQCAKISRLTGAAVLMLSHVNSEAVKSGPSLAGIYGGQAASFDPEGIMEIRRADPEETGPMRSIHGLVLKNRYGEVGVRMKFKFEGEYMTYHEDFF